MTVEVETPEGLRSGSAVRLVAYKGWGWFPLAEVRPHWRVKGQAVIVDLPNGRSLYALLRSNSVFDVDYGDRIADRAMGVTGGRIVGWPGPVELYPTHPKTSGLAETNPLPMMVTFSHPLDSTSVERVDPNNLAGAFGPGYKLRRISIDIVERPVTHGIETRLPWLRGTALEQRLIPWGGVRPLSEVPPVELLTTRDFVQR